MEDEEKLLKVHQMNRMKVITNIILIIVLVLIGIYVVYNLETIKSYNGDICRLCEDKTGGVCYMPVQVPYDIAYPFG